jgi:PAS domain S-box-containing protein
MATPSGTSSALLGDNGRSEPELALPTREELRALEATVHATAGEATADRVLFEVGLRVGRELAAALPEGAPLAERIGAGFASFGARGFGSLEVRSLEAEPGAGRFHLAGTLTGSFENELGRCARRQPTHAASGFTAGFLSSLLSRLSGLDLASTPIGCSSCLAPGGCRFDVRPSHEFTDVEGPRHAPPGSPRFFLGAVGPSLAGAEVSLDDMLETTDDAVILIDNEDVVRFWNRGAERMFQFTPDEVVGRRIGRIVPQDVLDSGELERMRRELDQGRSVNNFITRRVRKDGVERWCSLTRTPLRDAHGRVVGSTAILKDITEQRRTEAELARSRTLAAVGEMSAKIAHEIKNPLAGIYAAVQVLSRELPPSHPHREIFDEIGEEVRRVDQTVIDMLRFSRPVPPKLAPHSLRAIVRDVVDPLRRVFPSLAVEVRVPDELVLAIDERMLSQVIENLVSNALQAADGKGTRVIVESRIEPEAVVLEVRDDGPGVPPALREEIFEPFVTTKTRGTGLGLPIARKNVAAHDGTLTLGTAPEGGASFRVQLPLSALANR